MALAKGIGPRHPTNRRKPMVSLRNLLSFVACRLRLRLAAWQAALAFGSGFAAGLIDHPRRRILIGLKL